MKIKKIKAAKKIAIIGFGKEGKSTLAFLEKIGLKNISILDFQDIEEKYSKKYSCISGKGYLDKLEIYDLIIKSVGISPYKNKQFTKYASRTITATEIFLSNYLGKIIGITGTKGKSTTSSLCYHVLASLGYNVALIGNIGNPALDVIDQKFDYVIYELSSYMLEGITPNLEVGVLINIFHDHLDWYGGNFSLYKAAKENVLTNAKIKIINHSLTSIIGKTQTKNALYYNKRDKDLNFHEGNFYIGNQAIFSHEGIHLEGEHNMENITCVLSILHTLKIDLHDIKKILTNFCALPHRLEDLGNFSGIRFIDDSISTTPESTIEAIKTYKYDIGTLFLGGTDRGYNFKNLIGYIKKYKINNIILFPESGRKIKKLLGSSYNYIETDSMQEAVKFAFEVTEKGKICLLSTASPSYILWKNFEAQGEDFKTCIKNYQFGRHAVNAQ